MGRSVTPTYAFSMETYLSRIGRVRHTPMAWSKEYGRPTLKNIDKWVSQYEESCINGVNRHLGIDPVLKVEIKRNFQGGEIVATWIRNVNRNEPLFQII